MSPRHRCHISPLFMQFFGRNVALSKDGVLTSITGCHENSNTKNPSQKSKLPCVLKTAKHYGLQEKAWLSERTAPQFSLPIPANQFGEGDQSVTTLKAQLAQFGKLAANTQTALMGPLPRSHYPITEMSNL